MSFVFIDRIVRFEADRQIVTLKNFTLSDDVFRDHFIGRPVVPGSLLVEALAQAATALLEISSGYTKKALPIMVERVKFRAPVVPGDQLHVTVQILQPGGSTAQLEGEIHVADRLVANARFTFACQDVDAFYPEFARTWVRNTYDYWLKHAEIVAAAKGDV